MISEISSDVKHNLILFSVFSLLSSFVLTRGVFLIYLSSKGLSLLEVATYQAVYSISSSILEIPTGYFGDRFGKKKSLLLGMILLVSHSFFMILSGDLVGFLIMGVLEALAYSFISGSDSALLYEILEDMNSKEKYLKINSFLLSARSITTGSALLIGSFIAKFSWDLLYILTMIIFTVSIFSLMFVKERKVEKKEKVGKTDFTYTKENLKKNILYHAPIVFIIFFIASSLIDGFFMSYYNFNQLIMQDFNITVEFIGMFFSILYFINSIAYLSVNFLTKYFSKKQLFIYILFIEFILFLILSFVHLPVIIILLSIAICFFPEILFTISDSIIQQYIRSDYRATILSSVSLLRSLMSSIIYIVLGYCFELFSIQTSILLIGIIGLIGCFTLLILAKNYKIKLRGNTHEKSND